MRLFEPHRTPSNRLNFIVDFIAKASFNNNLTNTVESILNSFKLSIRICILLSILTSFQTVAWDPLSKQSNTQSGASKRVELTIDKFKNMPELEAFFTQADGYAVFPNIAKAGFGIGAAVGKGEVFRNNIYIGKTSVKQLSIGLQLGAQAFSEIIFFKDKRDTDRFTEGNFELGAQASAVLITQGISAETAYSNGTAIFTLSKGGLMYEVSVSGQKFSFEPTSK
jgi:lipid-binding SYLF domain-containing protein